MDGTSHANGVSGTIGSGTGTVEVDRSHPTVDLAQLGEQIRRLHDAVCGHGKRVEVTRAGCDDVCVLIGKHELEAMEAALAYYANASAHADLCRGLAKMLAEAGVVHAPRAYAPGEVVRTFADDCFETASI